MIYVYLNYELPADKIHLVNHFFSLSMFTCVADWLWLHWNDSSLYRVAQKELNTYDQ